MSAIHTNAIVVSDNEKLTKDTYMKRKALFITFALTIALCGCAEKKNTETISNENGKADFAELIDDSSKENYSEPEEHTDTDETATDSEEITDASSEESTDDTTYSDIADSSDINDESMTTASAGTYKEAYIAKIKEEQKIAADLEGDFDNENYEETIDSYWLYDIDKDGTPELFIKYGHDEASFHGMVFTCVDGEIKSLDGLNMGHSAYYGIPNENGILSYWGHMGYGECMKVTLNNGELSGETLYAEDINEKLDNGEDVWYKAADEIVPGAYLLDSYDYNNLYPIEEYEKTLEFSYKEGSSAGEYKFPEDDPEYYTKIVDSDTIVNAFALSQFMKSPGEVPFSDLLKDKVIYEYAKAPLKVHDFSYADLNDDGNYECVFYIDPDDDSVQRNQSEYGGIMTVQDGDIYVYLTFYPSVSRITEDGFFVTDPDEYSNERYVRRIMYDKEKCFRFAVPQVD